MKVLFVYPNLHARIGFNYGACLLSAALEAAGHDTALVNAYDSFELRAASPDAITGRVATRAGRELYPKRCNPFTAVTSR